MSTLKVTNIQDTSGGNNSTSAEIYEGRAKAHANWYWSNNVGTGVPTLRSSYNVNSLTDNGSGDITITFTTSLSDANYTCVGSFINTGDNYTNVTSSATRAYGTLTFAPTGAAPTASAVRCQTCYGAASGSNGGAVDAAGAIAIY